jgi:hypothetical protein
VTGPKTTTKKSKASSAPKKTSATPGKSKATKAKGRGKKKDDGEGTESEDNDYVPAKRRRGDVSSDSDVPIQVFDSQGEEVTEESEHLRALVRELAPPHHMHTPTRFLPLERATAGQEGSPQQRE